MILQFISPFTIIFLNFIQLYQHRAVLIVLPVGWFEISMVELVESDRNIFISVHLQLEQYLLPRRTPHWDRMGHISLFVETYHYMLKMRENVFLLNRDLSPP